MSISVELRNFKKAALTEEKKPCFLNACSPSLKILNQFSLGRSSCLVLSKFLF